MKQFKLEKMEVGAEDANNKTKKFMNVISPCQKKTLTRQLKVTWHLFS